MRASTTIILSTLALVQTAFAIPPACLLGALNNDQQNLADINTICRKNAADVQGSISSICGDMTDEAMAYFAATCRQVANVMVASAVTSSATRTSQSGGATSTATGTLSSTDVLVNPTPTGNSTGSAASGSASPMGAAATNIAGSFVVVAVAAAGIIAAV